MIPGFAIRIDSMTRALNSVIMPAIDPENRLAQEQAALLMAQLSMMSTQWDKVAGYARLSCSELNAMAQRLKPEGGPVTIAAADELSAILRQDSPPGEDAYRNVSAAVEKLVHAVDEDGTEAFRKRLHREVLEHGKRQALHDRAWFVACGFDVNASELPKIEDLISDYA